MNKKNPFAIRKTPSEMINAQALVLDDYVNRAVVDHDKLAQRHCSISM